MAGESSWQFEKSTRRFKDTRTGKFLSEAHVTQARDAFLLDQQQQYRELTARMTAGDLSVQEWVRNLRQSIKESYSASYMLGRGGREAMTKTDWGAVGRQCRDAYGYADRFAAEVSAGRLTAAQAQARSALYASSAVQAHARGVASAWDITLPAYPADGKTPCRSNCACRWVMEDGDTELRATWTISEEVENCDGCLERADEYNPYVVTRATDESAA